MMSQVALNSKLTKVLLAENTISKADLERAADLSLRKSITLDRAILSLGMLEEDELLLRVSDIYKIPFIASSSGVRSDFQLLSEVTLEWCLHQKIAPVCTDAGESIVLLSDPLNEDLIREIRFFFDSDLMIGIAPSHVVREMLAQSDTVEAEERTSISSEQRKRDGDRHGVDQLEGPVIRFVADILDAAVIKGASDVHFESQENGLRVRLRIEGVLQAFPVDHALSPTSVLARIKVLASMNVSQRRLPQDGRIAQTIGGRNIDFRVSSIPTSFGESIVCRVLDPKALRLGWERLGFDTETTRLLLEILNQSSGLLLVTGPTGSGKTTTLYTALSHLNQEGRKILTIEDPIEYNLAGVEQVQVHEEVGMTFAVALRAFLRQDPNVIMVGEIRDEETAEIACRAALVGRLVLSTLHTNSAESTIVRLRDLGVPKYIVEDVLLGVLSQRLEPNATGALKLTYELKGMGGN